MRFGLVLVAGCLLMLFTAYGCEDTQTVDQTGFELVADNCIAIGIYVHIDDEYFGFAGADQPKFFPLPAGNYHLFAIGNARLSMDEDDPFPCWTREISINDGQITEVFLDCEESDDCYQ